MSIILENYVGKTSNMKKAEEAMGLFLKEMYSGYAKKGGTPTILNKSPHLKNVCTYLNKEFKFKKIHLDFSIIDTVHFNAGPHTIPSTFIFFTDTKKIDRRTMEAFVFINPSFVLEYKFTAAEMMAIILHELGHNIDLSIPTRMSHYLTTLATLGLFPIIAEVIRRGKFTLNQLYDAALKQSGVRKAIIEIQTLLRTYDSITRFKFLANYPYFIISAVLSTIQGVHLGYYGERKSDAVATEYGYGPALITALHKMDTDALSETVVKSNPLSGLAYDFVDAIRTSLLVFMTPHPANINRAKNSLYQLKEAVDKPTTPESLKPNLRKEIAQIEKTIKDMETINMYPTGYNLFTSTLNKILGFGSGRNRNILDFIYNAEKYEDK